MPNATAVVPDSSVKEGPVTVTAIVILVLRLPEVPVTITFVVPVPALAEALKVSTLLLLVLVGLKVAVTPVGKPLIDSETLSEKPYWGRTLTVLIAVPLMFTDTAGTLDASWKDGGWITNANDVDSVIDPASPRRWPR
jgi:hypothetical protein